MDFEDNTKRVNQRRRSTQAKDSILAATYQLLLESGARALTIEGVAARAGVGKTTIYRWWPNKSALAVEAFLVNVTPVIDYVDTGSAQKDILSQMHRLAQAFSGPIGKIVKEMVAEGQFDNEALQLFHEGFLKPRRNMAQKILQSGIARGEFKRDIDFDVVIDALYGPIHHRLMFGRAMDDENFLQTITKGVMNLISVKDDE